MAPCRMGGRVERKYGGCGGWKAGNFGNYDGKLSKLWELRSQKPKGSGGGKNWRICSPRIVHNSLVFVCFFYPKMFRIPFTGEGAGEYVFSLSGECNGVAFQQPGFREDERDGETGWVVRGEPLSNTWKNCSLLAESVATIGGLHGLLCLLIADIKTML